MFDKYLEYYAIILREAFFCGHAVYNKMGASAVPVLRYNAAEVKATTTRRRVNVVFIIPVWSAIERAASTRYNAVSAHPRLLGRRRHV